MARKMTSLLMGIVEEIGEGSDVLESVTERRCEIG
jgi:hypothetical protein